MPRNRVNEQYDDNNINNNIIEEDYLDVDKELPNQNFCCLSFVSPEKVIEQKEFFMYYHYEKAFYNRINTLLEENFTKIIDNCDDGKVDISDIVKFKKTALNVCKQELTTFKEFKDKFEDFRFRDEDKIGKVFDEQNKFKTSVRGIKVRGVFNTKNEADIRAKVLQRLDPVFDVFIAQVGYWCPWDPNPHKIDDVEYANAELNKLVKEYKENEAKKDHFYSEQKQQRQKDAISLEERLKHQQGIQNQTIFTEPSISINNNTIPNTLELGEMNNISLNNVSDTTLDGNIIDVNNDNLSIANTSTLHREEEILESIDPWLQRKQ